MSRAARLALPAALVAGAVADAVVADPPRWHPVAGYGRLAGAAERMTYGDHELAGAAYALALVGGAVAATRAAERALPSRARPALTAAVTAVALGGTSLRREARAMAAALAVGDLEGARRRLPALCGRDPVGLDATGLVRATIESVAENTSDAVVGTLWWGAALGPAGIVLHRAANTLDAMVGYRTRRHRRFGRAVARLDDLVNLGPARLSALVTVALAPTAGGSAADAWRVWRRDAAAHPSPNAGPVEAAMAGTLGVTLGGTTNRYGDHADARPAMGDGPAPTVADLHRAIALSTRVSLAAVALAALAAARPRRDTPAPREVAA